ncbi:MAG: hypothetical protein Fur0023_20670 [Bacteroidia bacterium]
MIKIFLILFIFGVSVSAQTLDSVQIVRSFQIGAGRILSTLALQENYDDVEYIIGWDFNTNFLFHNLTRIEFKYCNFEKTDILPFWKNAHLQNFNLNYHVVISNETGSFFIYPSIGAAYTLFQSYQVMDKNFRSVNTDKTYTQLGLNGGLGAELHAKFFSIFVDYNMRVTKITSDNTPNVRNVGFSAGIRLFYFQLHWRKNNVSPQKKNIKKRKRRKVFDLLHDRYHWF